MRTAPTKRALVLADAIAKKDWTEVQRRIRRSVENGPDDVEYWKDAYAHAYMNARRMGEKLRHWARLIALSAGLPIERTPADEEVEALLVGWSTQRALAVAELGATADRWYCPKSDEWHPLASTAPGQRKFCAEAHGGHAVRDIHDVLTPEDAAMQIVDPSEKNPL